MKILLADNHPVIRSTLKDIIREITTDVIFDEADKYDNVLEKVINNDYALVIMDINLHGGNAESLISNAIQLNSSSHFLIFTMQEEEGYAKRYFELGARGYLSKIAPIREIQTAMGNIMHGEKYFTLSNIAAA